MNTEDNQARIVRNTISAYPQKALDILGIPMSQVEKHLDSFPTHFVATVVENKFTLIRVFYTTIALRTWCESTLLDFGHLVDGLSPEDIQKLLAEYHNTSVYTLPFFLHAVADNKEGHIEFNTNKAAILREFDDWVIEKEVVLEQKWKKEQMKKVLW